MDESHLGPGVDPPENPCGTLCDKIMKNMVLTLTILGKLFIYIHSSTIWFYSWLHLHCAVLGCPRPLAYRCEKTL